MGQERVHSGFHGGTAESSAIYAGCAESELRRIYRAMKYPRGRNVSANDVLANVTYGTKRVNAYIIIEDTLKLKNLLCKR